MHINKKTFIIAILIPALFLISLTIKPLTTIMLGDEILLETRPFDPRDVFRGDYVNLGYEIEEIPIEKFPVALQNKEFTDTRQVKKATNNGTIYGVLKIKNSKADIAYISLERPSDKPYIKGKIVNYYQFIHYDDKIPEIEKELITEQGPEPIYINFGLDKYFVAENTGEELEKRAREGKVLAKVKLLNGYGILTDIK
ncbi:Uncharacterized membrane-anchored protein [Desulfonispora thiosulfatigenes DSM 11270]|uniref:Uncharacterized membrane-anchored protein n=1 Tax=Desulfonispora thiosulfatigenes DSM 11270 TaxID=656914 RepID=A0A1W1VCX2_DESTI|nr:GDYXXLXY domain-containing protein [Desulfonispora thiosulfatigenes]SMB91040.1 Uncharacterized membrane-anchored protein [Desulfonispora thiosulfatigenes DSM 11270]